MICDKCKAEVLPTAKFCPACGAKVEAVQPAAAQGGTEGATTAAGSEKVQAEAPPVNVEKPVSSQATQQVGRKTSTGLLAAVILLVLLAIAGAGGYLYYTGVIGKTPARLSAQISDELKAKGLNLYCEVDKNWTATLRGSVKSPADKETAMGIVKAHKEVKDVKDELQPQVSPADLKLAVDNALSGAGFMDIHAEVDENLVATLEGIALSEGEKASALNIARAVDKVKDVKDNIQVEAAPPPPETASQPPLPAEQPRQAKRPGGVTARRQAPEPESPDPFELEVRINRALQDAGFKRVRARVGERFNVVLNGHVVNENRRAKAIEIAKSFNGVINVRDKIIVSGD
jgi:osmotically-inducible protein OsmY